MVRNRVCIRDGAGGGVDEADVFFVLGLGTAAVGFSFVVGVLLGALGAVALGVGLNGFGAASVFGTALRVGALVGSGVDSPSAAVLRRRDGFGVVFS